MSVLALEDVLSSPESIFRSLVEQSLVGIYIIQDGRFPYVNPRLAEMFGYTQDEITRGKSPADLTAEEDQGLVADNLRARLQKEVQSVRYSFRGKRRDGTLFDVEVHGTRREINGRPAIIGVALDVTERKRAEQALQSAHQELERRVHARTAELSKANADLVKEVAERQRAELERNHLLAREQGARAEAEAAEQRAAFLAEASKLLAFSLDYEPTLASVARLAVPHLADWCVVDVLAEDHSIRRMAVAHADSAMEDRIRAAWCRYPLVLGGPHPIAKVLRTGQPELIPEIPESLLVAIAENREHLDLLRTLNPQSLIVVPLLARNRTLGAMAFVSRKTGRRYGPSDLALAEDLARRAALAMDNARLYREAQETDRRKDGFLAMLAHELRNPLAPILNAVQVLDEIGAQDSQAIRMREIIGRQARQLARLVDDLLDVARIRSGRITLQRQPVDMKDVVQRCLESLRASGRADRCDVSLSSPPEPVIVDGDLVRLEQVIWNLLDNAVKYSPPGGPIRITVDHGEGEAVVRVEDSGLGIAPEMLPHLFAPFSQAAASLDRSDGGLGLGLSVVRTLVEKHEGSVTAHSPGPGKGSEFVVRLPLARTSRAPVEREKKPTATPLRHILIVEDRPDSREALRALLERSGHRVEVAADGGQGLEMALASTPDIALIDIGLPVMDGYEVVRNLRANPRGKEIHLIALTGYGQPEDSRRVFESGFDAHLIKPVNPEELRRAIARHPTTD